MIHYKCTYDLDLMKIDGRYEFLQGMEGDIWMCHKNVVMRKGFYFFRMSQMSLKYENLWKTERKFRNWIQPEKKHLETLSCGLAAFWLDN